MDSVKLLIKNLKICYKDLFTCTLRTIIGYVSYLLYCTCGFAAITCWVSLQTTRALSDRYTGVQEHGTCCNYIRISNVFTPQTDRKAKLKFLEKCVFFATNRCFLYFLELYLVWQILRKLYRFYSKVPLRIGKKKLYIIKNGF